MKPDQKRRRLRLLASQAGDLVDALNEIYPAAPPRLTDTDREVWFNAGRRDVVEFLQKLREEASTRSNVLED